MCIRNRIVPKNILFLRMSSAKQHPVILSSSHIDQMQMASGSTVRKCLHLWQYKKAKKTSITQERKGGVWRYTTCDRVTKCMRNMQLTNEVLSRSWNKLTYFYICAFIYYFTERCLIVTFVSSFCMVMLSWLLGCFGIMLEVEFLSHCFCAHTWCSLATRSICDSRMCVNELFLT